MSITTPENTSIHQDIRSFVRRLDEAGELVRVDEAIDDGFTPAAAMWELYDRMALDAPALLFEDVEGREAPLALNLFGNFNRWKLALGWDDWYEEEQTERSFKPVKDHLAEALRNQDEWLAPTLVDDAPAQDVVLEGDEARFDAFPIFQWHPTDAGPYVTLGATVNEDPEWGGNFGLYRIMVIDEHRACIKTSAQQDVGVMLRRAKRRGEGEIDVAIATGYPPHLYFPSTMKTPRIADDSEYRLAGALAGEPLAVTEAVGSDLRIPAHAEIVFEGRLQVDERHTEGPFGEYNGYASEPGTQPVFELDRVTHREDPIYVSCTPAHAYSETNLLFIKNVNVHWENQMRTLVPGFRDANFPTNGRLFVGVVSIKKRRPGWGRQALHALLGSGSVSALVNTVVVVDDDVDVYDFDDVLYAIATRVDPELDTFTTQPAATSALNPAARAVKEDPETEVTTYAISSKLGIDATRPTDEEPGRSRGAPPRSRPDENAIELVRERWTEFGLPE